MKFEIAVEYEEDESLCMHIYEDALRKIINKCFSEVFDDEQGNNISEGIN